MSRTDLTFKNSDRPQTESFGSLLWSSLFIAFLFAAVSFLSSPIPGVNEPHYLTKARAFNDPTWCSRDFFLTSSNAHFCFFWLVGTMTRILSLDSIAVIGRVTSSLLLATGWTMLGRSLGLHAAFRIGAAGLFASLSLLGSFSGEWLLGGFESKVPAWGFSLMAVSLWISGQLKTCPGWMTAAGVAGGIACTLHPVVGGWVSACMCMASSWNFLTTRLFRSQQSTLLQPSPFKAVIGLTCFSATTIVLSLPGLIPALRLVLDTSTPQKDRQLAAFFQVFWRLKHHLDPTELPAQQWLYALFVGGGLIVCWRWLKNTEKSSVTDLAIVNPPRVLPAYNHLITFFFMSFLVALAGVVIGWHTTAAQKMNGWEWRAALLKFYPFRCFDALLPISLALVLGGLAQTRTVSTIAKMGRPRVAVIVACFLSLPLLQAWHTRESVPAGYTADQFSGWHEACEWIRNNTPREALFLTPRESFAFKWFAERAEFVCYKDCPQDAPGILTWNKRLWMLHDWTLQSSSDLRYDNRDLETLRKQTDCDYILTRILGPFEAEPLWQGREWRIYAVPRTQP